MNDTDMEEYNNKWHLVQPSRDMPIDEDEDIEYMKACEEEEEYNRMLIFNKKPVEFNFEPMVVSKKIKKKKEGNLVSNKKIIELPSKDIPKIRCFNPRLPPPDKYKITGYNKTFKLNNIEFPSL